MNERNGRLSQPRKALFLSESQGWSGGARQLLKLAEGLGSLGWDVTIACPGDGDTFQKARESGLLALDLHPRQDYDLISALKLAVLLAERGFDVLHAHHPRAHAVGLMAAYLCRARPAFIVTRRVSFPVGGNVFSRFKYASPRIDGYIAVAESIRKGLIAAGVPAGKVVTIPSGVDLEAFSPRPKDEALAEELRLPAGVSVIGKIANFGSWKGQDVFLRAAGLLKKRGVKAVYLCAGRDTDSAEIKALAAGSGLSDEDVRFLGFRPDVPRLLSLLDASVNASTAGEGLSGAIRESLAMQVPVAAGDVGGNAELVEDGVTGRLFRAGDAEALAGAVTDILRDPDSARKQAAAGRRSVLERFSQRKIWSATADFYDCVLARERPGAERFEYVG